MDRHHDCGPSCASKGHQDELTAATTKGSAAQLVAYLPRCFNYARGKDSFSRSQLHVAASCGKTSVVRWLLHRKGAPVNDADAESRWTPLHRSLFYGQLSCVRLLLSNGASLSLSRDAEGLTPLDLLAKDAFPHVALDLLGKDAYMDLSRSVPLEAYTWGTNLNYTLGHGGNQSKETPDVVEALRRGCHDVKDVVLGKFHSLFRTSAGIVFACGYGQGGRLGLGKNESSCLAPLLLEAIGKENCVEVAVGQDHSLFLMENGGVWGCGSNAVGQLGFAKSQGGNPPPLACNEPRQISTKFLKGQRVVGISCGKEYSVLNTGEALFASGRNHGQFGFTSNLKGNADGTLTSKLMENHDFSSFAYLKVSALITKEKSCAITSVACSESAMVVLTDKGDIYFLSNHKFHKIPTPKKVDAVSVQICANKSTTEEAKSQFPDPSKSGKAKNLNISFHIVILSKTGKLYSWRTGDPQLRRCLFKSSLGREIYLRDVSLSRQGFVCVAEDGFAYSGSFAAGKPKSLKSIEKEEKSASSSKQKKSDSRSQSQQSSGWSGFRNDGSQSKKEFSHPLVKFLEIEECQNLLVKRIPFLARAVQCSIDPHGQNFAVLQVHPSSGITEIVFDEEGAISSDFKNLLDEAEDADVVHDAILKVHTGGKDVSLVGSTSIACHQYILASRCQYFRRLFEGRHNDTNGRNQNTSEENREESEDEGQCDADQVDEEEMNGPEKNLITIDNLNPTVFKQVLQFLYTETCDYLRLGTVLEMLPPTPSPNREPNGIEDFISASPLKSMSAYAAFKDGKKGGKTKTNESHGNPLEMLKGMAKRFGIKTLQKQLDAVFLDNGRVTKIPYKTIPSTKLRFEVSRHKWAYDVILKADDGVCFPCHRCILVARLEYFRAMLGCGWIETSAAGRDPLPMPFPSEVLRIILEYLYTDSAPSLVNTDKIDLACTVLIAADQLINGRLKSLCEVALADLLTLKNCAELLQFCVMYNASQLKKRVLQFICLNLIPLLEQRSLEVLNHEAMSALTSAYLSLHPTASSRRLTPHHQFVDLDKFDASDCAEYARLMEEEEDLKVEEDEAEFVERNEKKKTRGKAMAKKKRDRKASIGLVHEGEGTTPESVGTLLSTMIKSSGKIRKSSTSDDFGAQITSSQVNTKSATSDNYDSQINTKASDDYTCQVNISSDRPQNGISSSAPICIEIASDENFVEVSKHKEKRDSTLSVWGTKSPSPQPIGLSPITGPSPITKSLFEDYLDNVGKDFRSLQAEESRRAQGASSPPERPTVSRSSAKDEPLLQPSGQVRSLSWASKPNSAANDEDTQDSMSKSFKELMLEDSRKGAGCRKLSETEETPKHETSSEKLVKRKISFGLSGGGHFRFPSEKPKTEVLREGLPQDGQGAPSLSPSRAPHNPWINFQSKDDIELVVGPKSPKSPLPSPRDNSGPSRKEGAVSLSKVILEEEKAKERWRKETHKPLHLIQIEERALQELKLHYEMVYGRDGEETITVERAVESYNWQPLWRHTNKETGS